MQVEISSRTQFSKLHPNTQKALKKLTVNGWTLRIYINQPELLLVNIAYYKGRIIGWLAIIGEHAMFYVHPKFRRMGIGTLLANRINKKRYKCSVGVRGSDKFFESCKIKYSR